MPTHHEQLPAVLVVEDDPLILLILYHLINRLTGEYQLVTVSNGQSALQELEKRAIPLVITDYNMPGMDGLELTDIVKQRQPDACVVLISAYATPELERLANAHHVDYYLPKPFSLARMEEIVLSALHVKAA